MYFFSESEFVKVICTIYIGQRFDNLAIRTNKKILITLEINYYLAHSAHLIWGEGGVHLFLMFQTVKPQYY